MLKERAEIKLPTRARLELPPQAKGSDGPLRWALAWTKSAEDELTVKLDCELTKSELSMPETAQFQRQVRELFTVLSRPAIVSVSNPNNP
jgi:hypothetical protein